MALKLKYTDEHGILHINMSPSSSPAVEEPPKNDLTYPKFDTINHRFANYDIFGGKYDVDSGAKEGGDGDASAQQRSLFRSRYNSIEEELANTPYAFSDRRSPAVDITINNRLTETSPSKDIEDDRFFNRAVNVKFEDGLFGPSLDFASKSSIKSSDEEEVPAFTVTQLIHAQDRYFDLSGKHTSLTVLSDIPVKVKDYNSPRCIKSEVKTVKDSVSRVEVQSAPTSARRTRTVSVKSEKDEAFKVLPAEQVEKVVQSVEIAENIPASSATKKKKESSFAILTETPISSRPSSPRSLPIETRRVSPFRGHGFREETSRHTTPKSSTNNSRASSPPRRRTNSLSKIENMASTAIPPLPIHTLNRPHSPRNFVKQNIEEVRELSELNREKHEAEAEIKRKEEEEALLIEMGLLEKNTKTSKSTATSRNTSRSNSPSKLNLRSRSNSPSAILHFENINASSKEFINADDGTSKPVTHRSRLRSVSKSQPQSNNGSPKHSKIPKRQNSVSPPRNNDVKITNKLAENNLNKNQRFISNSTSSINDSGIRIGGTVSEKKAMSKSSQHLSISPSNIRGKPPISPGRGGPPPVNKSINAKRLSPIVGTPNKSPIENSKPGSARTPTKTTTTTYKKPTKTVGNTPSTSRQQSRAVSPDKKTIASKTNTNSKPKPPNKAITRTPSTKTIQKPTISSKPETKKPMNRTNSIKSLVRTPSTKTLNEKPPTLKRNESRKNLMDRANSNTKINESGAKKENEKVKETKKDVPASAKKKETTAPSSATQKPVSDNVGSDEKLKQDNETQYDSITNEKGELITLTRKNVVSMTTAAITAQPLEVVTTVTNQLPAALEKAREKGIFERHGSKDSIAPKEEKLDSTEINNVDEKKISSKSNGNKSSYSDDIKLKLLQPPYNNPQVERVKQKIDDILKAPEVSTESILGSGASEIKEIKNTLKSIANRAKSDIKEKKEETAKKFIGIKNEIEKKAEDTEKEAAKISEDIRSEATKIVDSIITPVEQPHKIEVPEKPTQETKIDIEPIVMVVNAKKTTEETTEIVEKINETLVKGEPEVEVQSSNVSTPVKMDSKKLADGNSSDHSVHSNGGFPQSTSTTPKPPARTKKPDPNAQEHKTEENKGAASDDEKKQNICKRLMGKCAQKTKCCGCCVKPEADDDEVTIKTIAPIEGKTGMSKWSCCKKKDDVIEDKMVKVDEKAAGKLNTIEFENETKRKRTFGDIFCGCCKRRHRIGDSATLAPGEQGCFGRRQDPEIAERRDSILSDRPPRTCCNNRFCNWIRGACRRQSDNSLSRRPSIFSKNKSLSPTLPPEDTRSKLDPSLVEHTSVIRGAIPVLPLPLAYFCLMCNVLVPGLGSILSGLFCLCFGIPRFGVHDGLKHRIGSLVINLLVGCGQIFTVLFCLVGWGWSIWWGVIMVRVSKKYRKLAAEAAAETEPAPPVTTNNHHSRA